MTSFDSMPMVAFDAIPTSSPESAGRGIGRLVQGFMDGLAGCSDRPGIACLRFEGDPHPKPAFEKDIAIPRRFWGSAAPWIRHVLMASTLQRTWLSSGCKIWHGSEPYLFPAPCPGRKSVFMMYDLIPLLMADQYVNTFKRGNQWLWKSRLPERWRTADAIVVNSQEVARTAVELLGIDPVKFHVVPLGVDTLDASPVPCPVEGKFFLYVGASDRRKNLPFLVRSFARFLSGRNDGFKLVIAGGIGDAQKTELLQIGADAGVATSMVLTGRIRDSELVALYRSAQGFVFPSLMEGFGLPPLEAMLQGCPVLSSSASCMPEILGDAALFANPVDIDAFAAGMTRLADDFDLANALKEMGQRHARKFTWEASANALKGVWNYCHPEYLK